MQTVLPQLPEVGKIYHSAKFPGFIVQIVSVEQYPTVILIHAIDKSDGGESQPITIFGEEWNHGEFYHP